MKRISLIACIALSLTTIAQNHSQKPIRFIFESIHDHLGNLDLNSKKVQLFNPDHQLLYEADMYDGKELDEQFFYYNADGKLLRDHRNFFKPHESGDYRMTYDAKGNLINETNYDDLGHEIEIISMTYNDKNQMISRKVEYYHHTEDAMIVEDSFEYTYDTNGKIAARTGFEGEHEDRTVTYKYKHEAKSETISKYNAAGDVREIWITKVDDKGRLLQDVHTLYQKGVARTKTIDFAYDEFDHILTETLSKSGSSLKKQIIFEYVYDEYGNWTERTEKKVAGARVTQGVHLKRHIEYYEHDKYEHPPMELDESFTWETHEGKEVKVFQESHVRINNNKGELEWVVRRNGSILYQVDEYEYKDGMLDLINHLNNEHHENAYTKATNNDKAQMTELITYSSAAKVDEKTTYQYDSKGMLVRKEEQFIDPAHGTLKVYVVEEYVYNAAGKAEKMDVVDYGSQYSIAYEYDDAGNVTKELMTTKEKGEENTRTEYLYEDGKLMQMLEYEGKAKEPTDKTTYAYDDRGELLQSADYREGKLHSEVDYVYFE